MNWQALTAAAALIGLGGAYVSWFVRITIRDELLKLNGTYVRAAGSGLTGHEIEQRLAAIEKALGVSNPPVPD